MQMTMKEFQVLFETGVLSKQLYVRYDGEFIHDFRWMNTQELEAAYSELRAGEYWWTFDEDTSNQLAFTFLLNEVEEPLRSQYEQLAVDLQATLPFFDDTSEAEDRLWALRFLVKNKVNPNDEFGEIYKNFLDWIEVVQEQL